MKHVRLTVINGLTWLSKHSLFFQKLHTHFIVSQKLSPNAFAIYKQLIREEQYQSLKNSTHLESMATDLARLSSGNSSPPQILVDISILAINDSHTGIQRVVRSILSELLLNPPPGYQVELIYATHESEYRYARQYTHHFLKKLKGKPKDDWIDYKDGDIFLGLDFAQTIFPVHMKTFNQMHTLGVRFYFVVYDLIPLFYPHFFPEQNFHNHRTWLNAIAKSDGIICISQTVANDMQTWLSITKPLRDNPLKIGYFHLGSNIEASHPTKSLPKNAKNQLKQIGSQMSFLVVGTIEPRKGHDQTLQAFELLWSQGSTIHLIFAGKKGWMMDALLEKIEQHPLLNQQLFWLEGISDEYLEKIYQIANCLIQPSLAEGFGLPLIEAAHYNIPIIARDILVFREVAGEHAYYFSGHNPQHLADAITHWILLHQQNKAPQSSAIKKYSWAQSTQQLVNTFLHDQWSSAWI